MTQRKKGVLIVLLVLIILITTVFLVSPTYALLIGYELAFKISHPFYDQEDIEATAQEVFATKNPSLCDRLPRKYWDHEPRESCYYESAILLNDARVCNNLSYGYSSICVTRIAAKTNNGTICNGDSKCLFSVAGANNDYENCINISEQYYKDQCFSSQAVHEKKLIICDSIASEDIRNICYSKLAIINWDISICNEKVSISLKGQCLNSFYPNRQKTISIYQVWGYNARSADRPYMIKYPSDWRTLYPESSESKQILSYYSDDKKNLGSPIGLLMNISIATVNKSTILNEGRQFIRIYKGILPNCSRYMTYKSRKIDNNLVLIDKYFCTDNYTLGLSYIDDSETPLSGDQIKEANMMLERIAATFME